MCSCSRNNGAAASSQSRNADRQAAADRAKAIAAARAANPSTSRMGPSGKTQSFALRTPGGSVIEFGSDLERRAYAARHF